MSNKGWSSEALWDMSVSLEVLTSNCCFLCQTVKNFCGCELSPSFSLNVRSHPASAVLHPAASFIVRLLSVFIRHLTGCLHVLHSQSMLSENKVFLMWYVRTRAARIWPTKTNETTPLHLLQHSNIWKGKRKLYPSTLRRAPPYVSAYCLWGSSNVRPQLWVAKFYPNTEADFTARQFKYTHLMKCRKVLWCACFCLSLWMLTCDSHQPWHWAPLNHQHWHRKRTKRSKLVYGQIKSRQNC